MSSFEIIGGHKLHGEIHPQGAKNEALQVLCAVLLTSDKVVIENIPDIRDVNKLIGLLQLLGVKVRRLNDDSALLTEGRSYEFQADEVDLEVLEGDDFAHEAGALRGSIMMVGPLLSRYGRARVPQPGGDKIGRRRLDTHFLGMEKLGATGGSVVCNMTLLRLLQYSRLRCDKSFTYCPTSKVSILLG